MILLEVHSIGIAAFKLERNAPWTIDMNGVTRRPKTLEHMEIIAGEVQVFRSDSPIKHSQTPKDTLVET